VDEYLRVVARGSDHMNEKYVTSVTNVFDEYVPLECVWCEKDLLVAGQGNVKLVYTVSIPGSKRTVVAAYAACKGECDKAAARDLFGEWECATTCEELLDLRKHPLGYQDLQDLMNPLGYITSFMALINELDAKEDYSLRAREELREIMLKISHKVFRKPTMDERMLFLEIIWWTVMGV
jgi:hypothetical protein